MTRRAILATLAALSATGAFAQKNEDDAALKALDNFLAGWNSRNPELYANALRFPHLILDGGRINQYSTREQMLAQGPSLWNSVTPDWDHSEWISRQIVQRIGDTVHVAGSWARKDKAGRTISTADVLYVVVKQEDGQWKIFARSGNRRLSATSGSAKSK